MDPETKPETLGTRKEMPVSLVPLFVYSFAHFITFVIGPTLHKKPVNHMAPYPLQYLRLKPEPLNCAIGTLPTILKAKKIT